MGAGRARPPTLRAMGRRRLFWTPAVTAWGSSRPEVPEVPAGYRGLRAAKTR